MAEVRISSPSRLHFGLIDLNGQIGRIDGGTGLALESPRTVISARHSDVLTVRCPPDPEAVPRAETAARLVMERYNLPPAEVTIGERPFAHVGLGSATQLLVGVAHALCLLNGIKRPSIEIASVVNRGGTSGIGVAAFDRGGFILDGGHRFRCGFDSKGHYSPSSAVKGLSCAPTIARLDFPDWDILLVIPAGTETSGLREVDIFKIVCPIALDEVRAISHIVLMKMLPAIVERDLEGFGQAIEESQRYGFKAFEFRAQAPEVIECVGFMKDSGGHGVGMSSWGPTLFAFGEDLTQLRDKTQAFMAERTGGSCLLTKADNQGMRVLENTAG